MRYIRSFFFFSLTGLCFGLASNTSDGPLLSVKLLFLLIKSGHLTGLIVRSGEELWHNKNV
jgi:hypothetical protein